MRIRNGFVSNSSSSSFTCDICGSTDGGFDISLSDFDMCECEQGHVMCNSHLQGADPDDYSEISSENCPICSMKAVSSNELVKFLVIIAGFKNFEEAKKFIMQNYPNRADYEKYLERFKR